MRSDDWIGTQTGDLVARLPFDQARPYLKPTVTEKDWKPLPRDRDSILAEMIDYMPFAWSKANEGRGISAGRSLEHFMAWTWLAGDDFGNLLEYQSYGKDHLRRLCEHYGWDASQWMDE